MLAGAMAFALLALMWSLYPDRASSYVPQVATNQANIGETTRLLESLGAYDIPATPASPGSVGSGAGWSDDAAHAVQELPYPGTAEPTDTLYGDLGRAGRRFGTFPRLAKFGSFTMGGVAGFVAWEAGFYVLGKIFSPADPPAGPVWNLQEFRLADPGGTIDRQCRVTVACDDETTVAYTVPATSRIYASSTHQDDLYYCIGGSSRNSPEAMVGALPQSATAVTTYTEAPIGAGTCDSRTWQHFSIVDTVGPGEFAPPRAPLGPAEGGSQIGSLSASPCSTDWTCPTSSNIEQKVTDELNTGTYEKLAPWLDHFAEPENFPDPTVPETQNENDHRCDVSEPSYQNPGGSSSPEPYEPKLQEAFETTGRPSAAPDAPDPYLRWGETTWRGAFQDNWDGWGWRHIQAKHGWSAADEAATRQTLLSPINTDGGNEGSTSMTYFGAEYTQNGAVCARTVVVEFGEHTGPKGIITSFGGFVREAP
jgi:hypothetical protein